MPKGKGLAASKPPVAGFQRSTAALGVVCQPKPRGPAPSDQDVSIRQQRGGRVRASLQHGACGRPGVLPRVENPRGGSTALTVEIGLVGTAQRHRAAVGQGHEGHALGRARPVGRWRDGELMAFASHTLHAARAGVVGQQAPDHQRRPIAQGQQARAVPLLRQPRDENCARTPGCLARHMDDDGLVARVMTEQVPAMFPTGCALDRDA